METSVCLLQPGNGNGKLPFICCKQKRKMEVCFPWSAQDKRNRLLLFEHSCKSMELHEAKLISNGVHRADHLLAQNYSTIPLLISSQFSYVRWGWVQCGFCYGYKVRQGVHLIRTHLTRMSHTFQRFASQRTVTLQDAMSQDEAWQHPVATPIPLPTFTSQAA